MFNNISGSYDFLNHFFSMGIDILWRKKAIRILKKENPKVILDVATGTGDFAIEALACNPDKVMGVDISEGMLTVGKQKMAKNPKYSKIELQYGDSENLPFENETFDAVTVSFGVRNFENTAKGLSDMLRVLKPNGLAVIIEFSKPKKFPIKQLYWFYFRVIMPILGKIISKDNAAYTYLPESVKAFPEGQEFLDIMNKCGYKDTKNILLTGGIASIYLGRK